MAGKSKQRSVIDSDCNEPRVRSQDKSANELKNIEEEKNSCFNSEQRCFSRVSVANAKLKEDGVVSLNDNDNEQSSQVSRRSKQSSQLSRRSEQSSQLSRLSEQFSQLSRRSLNIDDDDKPVAPRRNNKRPSLARRRSTPDIHYDADRPAAPRRKILRGQSSKARFLIDKEHIVDCNEGSTSVESFNGSEISSKMSFRNPCDNDDDDEMVDLFKLAKICIQKSAELQFDNYTQPINNERIIVSSNEKDSEQTTLEILRLRRRSLLMRMQNDIENVLTPKASVLRKSQHNDIFDDDLISDISFGDFNNKKSYNSRDDLTKEQILQSLDEEEGMIASFSCAKVTLLVLLITLFGLVSLGVGYTIGQK